MLKLKLALSSLTRYFIDSNYIRTVFNPYVHKHSSNVRDGIDYHFTKLNGCTIEVCIYLCIFTPNCMIYVIAYPCCDEI